MSDDKQESYERLQNLGILPRTEHSTVKDEAILKQKVMELSQKLEDAKNKRIRELMEENSSLAISFSVRKERLENLEAENAQLRDELAGSATACHEQADRIRDLELKLEAVSLSLAARQARVEYLEAENASLSRIADLAKPVARRDWLWMDEPEGYEQQNAEVLALRDALSEKDGER